VKPLSSLGRRQRTRIAEQVLRDWGEPRLRYVPDYFDPTLKQRVLLSLDRLDVFYGGAAGPGKSWGLLAGALQYVDVPGYAAIMFRRTFPELSQAGGLIEVSHLWLDGTDARYHQGDHQWTFPSGASLTFAHMQYETDKDRYRGASYQYIAFDELTTFTETQFRYLFGRLRRPERSPAGAAPDGMTLDQVPLRMRSASNPGGPGHDWVKERYIDKETRERRIFLPARLSENPHMDQAAYLTSLAELTEVERERLILGDWDAIDAGGMFEPSLWPTIARYSSDQWLRVWDLAGSKPTPEYPDPDWTVGGRIDRDRTTGQVYVTDVVRFREDPATTEEIVKATALRDGYGPVAIEQEPGSAGVSVITRYSRHVLQGLASVHAIRPTGDKVTRARAVAAAAGRGEVTLVVGPWNAEFKPELRRFPHGAHDDQVDVLAHGYNNIERLAVSFTTSTPGAARLPNARDRRAR